MAKKTTGRKPTKKQIDRADAAVDHLVKLGMVERRKGRARLSYVGRVFVLLAGPEIWLKLDDLEREIRKSP